MSKRALIVVLTSLGGLFGASFAAAEDGLVNLPGADGDADAGKAKSAVCAACHGPDGNSVNPQWPNIAGQHPAYTIEQLQNFKTGKRQNALMNAQAMALSDQDMEDLAAFYDAQAIKGGTTNPSLRTRGERIYRGGNKATGVSACIGCHGPDGKGNPLAVYPKLAGQHATYVALQLRAYAKGERRSDSNQIMRNIASAMSDEEIDAVASYVQGLR